MSRHLAVRQVETPAAEIRRLAVWLFDHAYDLCQRANRDMNDGIRSAALGGRPAPGHSDPTMGGALRPDPDPAGEAARKLVAELELAVISMRVAERLGRGLLPISASEASALVRESVPMRGSHCATCGRWVENTKHDPLRSGRCDACRKYRIRKGSERPRHLWEDHTVEAASG